MRVLQVAPGPDAPLRTLVEMARIARRAALDPLVLEAATEAVRPVGGRDTLGQAEALHWWLTQHVDFLPDPEPEPGDELLRAPDHLLREVRAYGYARGDCDDAAMLAAAMATAVGLPARFVALAWGAPPQFGHVYAEVDTVNGWYPLDVTEPSSAPRPLIVRRAFLEV